MRLGARLAVALVVIGSMAPPALATGGFGCRAYDSGASFDIGGATARDIGGRVVHASGSILVNGGPQAQIGLNNIVQYWSDNRSFRLGVAAHVDGDFIELTIQSSAAGNLRYAGTYTIRTTHLQRSGRVTCELG